MVVKYQSYRKRAPHNCHFSKPLKNFKRIFQKGIDKWEEMWYNSQAVRETESERSLKIEQQETKYKALRSAKY